MFPLQQTSLVRQLIGLAITLGIAGVLAWLLVSTGSESDPKPPPVGTARGGNFWVASDEERQNAFKQITKRIDLDASLPKSTPQGFVLRQIGQGQATAFEQAILDYYAPDLVSPPSPTPLPDDTRHVQVRVMRRDEMQSEIVEPIDLGVAGVTGGLTAMSHNERFSWGIPDGDAYALVGPKFAWRVLVWAGSGLSREELIGFLRTLARVE